MGSGQAIQATTHARALSSGGFHALHRGGGARPPGMIDRESSAQHPLEDEEDEDDGGLDVVGGIEEEEHHQQQQQQLQRVMAQSPGELLGDKSNFSSIG